MSQKPRRPAAVRAMSVRRMMALRTATLYLLIASAWIHFSDRWVESLDDPVFAARVSAYKGLLFVVVTAGLFFMACVSQPGVGAGIRARRNGALWPVLVILALSSLLVFGIGAVVYHQQQQAITADIVEDLGSEGDLKARHVAALIATRRTQAAAIGGDPLLGELVTRWRREGRAEDRQRLEHWLSTMKSGLRLSELALFTPDGEPLLGTTDAPADRRHIVVDAARMHAVVLDDLHRDQPGAPVHLEMAAPLAGDPAIAVVVIEQRADDALFGVIGERMADTRSGDAYLVRRGASGLQLLSPRLGRAETVLQWRFGPQAPLAQAIAAGRSGIVHISDDDGTPVLAYVKAVDGTPWLLVTQIDEREAYAGLRRNGWIIGMLLAVSATFSLLLAYSFLQRGRLHAALADVEQARVLRASEQRFRETFDNASIGMALVSLDGRFLRVNAVLCRMSGYSPDELLAMRPLDLVHPDDRAQLQRQRAEMLNAGVAETYEKRYVCKDGSTIWVEISPSTVRDEQGQPLYMIGAIKDVTPRRRAEEAYRLSEERFRLAMCGARQGVWDWDLSAGRVFYSETWAAMLGYAATELAPKIDTYRALLDDDGRACMDRELARVQARDAAFFETECDMRSRDGSVLRVLSHAFPVFGADGRLIRLVGTISNISERKAIEDALRERLSLRDQLARIADAVPGALFTFRRTPQGEYSMPYVAPPFEQMFDVAATAVANDVAPAFAKVVAEDLPTLVAAIEHSYASGEPFHCEFRVGGRAVLRWIEGRSVAYRQADGSMLWYGFLHDVSERKHQELQLRQAATVFAGTREGVVITDTSARILAVNPAFREITGYDDHELIGHNMSLLRSGLQKPEFYREMWAAIASEGYWQGEIWNRRKNGQLFPEWLTVSEVRDESGALVNYVGTFSDITHVKESEARLDYLAHHDVLTGLPNRLMLRSHLEHALRHCELAQVCGAVLMLDLDRFKNVNDALGHAAGDELLVATAQRLKDCLRDGDLVARLGGDEFVVVLENVQEQAVIAELAQKLIDCIERPFTMPGGKQACVGLSIGISLFPNDGSSVSDLFRHADAALYEAKDAGRGMFRFYSHALTRDATARLELESQLHSALERGELELHYQPLIRIGEGCMDGVEALVRWRRGGVEPMSPAQFIPIAEETGLIVQLGDWALRTACRQMVEWRREGRALNTMAVNLSPRQLALPDIVSRIATALADTGLPAHCLELEITEGTLAGDADDVRRKLAALKVLGVRIAVDDFGTGYSSLLYLKRFPVDKIKIDRGFVSDLPKDTTDAELVTAIIALGKILGLEVLAEGVETVEQLQFLRRNGCTSAQGFLFSPAVAPGALPRGLPTLQSLATAVPAGEPLFDS